MDKFDENFQKLVKKCKGNTVKFSEVKIITSNIPHKLGDCFLSCYNKQFMLLVTLPRDWFERNDTIDAVVKAIGNNQNKWIIEENIIGYLTDWISEEHISPLIDVKLDILSHEEKYGIISNISKILSQRHSVGMVHGSLNIENIYLNKANSEIIVENTLDYYYKTLYKFIRMWVFKFERNQFIFTSPEHSELENKPEDKCDVWSFGLIVSYIFSNEIPWNCYKNLPDLCKAKIKEKTFPAPQVIKDENIREIISLATGRDPSKRSSMKELNLMIEKIIFSSKIDNKNTKSVALEKGQNSLNGMNKKIIVSLKSNNKKIKSVVFEKRQNSLNGIKEKIIVSSDNKNIKPVVIMVKRQNSLNEKIIVSSKSDNKNIKPVVLEKGQDSQNWKKFLNFK